MMGNKRFNSLREARGMSQSELARQAGIYPADVSFFEANKKPIPRHHAPKLAKILGADEDYMFWILGYAPEDLRGVDEQNFMGAMKSLRSKTGRWKRI